MSYPVGVPQHGFQPDGWMYQHMTDRDGWIILVMLVIVCVGIPLIRIVRNM